MKKILLINQYNSDNLGDKLLNLSMIKEFEAKNFEVNNVGFAQLTEQMVSYNNLIKNDNLLDFVKMHTPSCFNYAIRYKKKLITYASNIEWNEIQAMIIGGGQLIKNKNVFRYCMDFWISEAEKHSIPIYLFGVGVDNTFSKKEILHYKKILGKVRYINCRDYESQSSLKKYFGLKSVVSPDIAFTYHIENTNFNKETIVVMPYNYKLAVRAFDFDMSRDEYYDYITQLVIKSKQNRKFSEIVLTATTSGDATECILFSKYLKKHEIQNRIEKISNIYEWEKLYKRTKVVITGRMHAMILGLMYRVEIEPLKISNKIEVFCKEYLEKEFEIDKVKLTSSKGFNQMLQEVNNE